VRRLLDCVDNIKDGIGGRGVIKLGGNIIGRVKHSTKTGVCPFTKVYIPSRGRIEDTFHAGYTPSW
jgi:hypothetical protein